MDGLSILLPFRSQGQETRPRHEIGRTPPSQYGDTENDRRSIGQCQIQGACQVMSMDAAFPVRYPFSGTALQGCYDERRYSMAQYRPRSNGGASDSQTRHFTTYRPYQAGRAMPSLPQDLAIDGRREGQGARARCTSALLGPRRPLHHWQCHGTWYMAHPAEMTCSALRVWHMQCTCTCTPVQ